MLDTVTTYILTLAPAIVAVISVITSVIVLIKKTHAANGTTAEELKKATSEMNKIYSDFNSVLEQNRQLKTELDNVLHEKAEENIQLKQEIDSLKNQSNNLDSDLRNEYKK